MDNLKPLENNTLLIFAAIVCRILTCPSILGLTGTIWKSLFTKLMEDKERIAEAINNKEPLSSIKGYQVSMTVVISKRFQKGLKYII